MAYKVFISPEDRAGNVYAGTALWDGKPTNEKEQIDHVTVHSDERMVFHFKTGHEITVQM